ncbi:MAG: hypothetical protein JSS93_02605 [Bacteroidetes bacterium]|nr:hypothetical protein [Bacteroidota bacterium]MBS1559573.1 hypothetical protein [Bacteroidota bacterium]
MKYILLFFVVALICLMPGCSHHDLLPDPSKVQNITLYDKSVSTIKHYIAGKWKLNYRTGGLSGHDRTDYDSTYFEFQFQTRDIFIRIDTGKVTINTPITWDNSYPSANGSPNVVMTWPLNPIQLDFYASAIKDWDLILTEPCSDCYSYYLSRIKQ